MTIRAVLFDLDNTLTHRDQSILAYSQHLANTYQQQLQQVEISQIQSIIRRIDNGGYPKKELLTHPSIAASVAYALQQELDWNSLILKNSLNFGFSNLDYLRWPCQARIAC